MAFDPILSSVNDLFSYSRIMYNCMLVLTKRFLDFKFHGGHPTSDQESPSDVVVYCYEL